MSGLSAGFVVRRAGAADMARLQEFFARAYGTASMFTDAGFLLRYFGQDLRNSFVAVEDGCVLAHYGLRPQRFRLHGHPVILSWGVNAFTLPKARSQGVGRALVAKVMEEVDVFGVLGFQAAITDFYRKRNFNLFNEQLARRWVIGLRPEFLWAVEAVGGDPTQARAWLRNQTAAGQPSSRVDRIDRGNVSQIGEIEMTGNYALSAIRDAQSITERFFSDPISAYDCRVLRNPRGQATGWIATRRETLQPLGGTATRIVDIAGDRDRLFELVSNVVSVARERGDWYVEVTIVGTSALGSVFTEAGFAALADEQATWIPLVCSPVQPRSNTERLGIWCRDRRQQQLAYEDIFITRAASDRDRPPLS